ncbi:SigE family RNA polymerase sigma factor [Actinoplanes sp. NPDC051470]|uniref:SigE family RNA polymerase sigma factor n=1 Tax=unclassified Actinoplanes TaxID=2626549 RepID=UPI00342346DB
MAEQPMEFAAFYRDAKDGCLRAVFASTGNRQLAEDLVSEAFAKAFSSWPKVARHPSPRAWVVRTALNTHISWWRRRRREVPWTAHLESVQVGTETGAEDSWADATVMNALRELPDRQRQVVALRIFLDLDTETTARTLGIAPGTVTAHLARATDALRNRLAPSINQETTYR